VKRSGREKPVWVVIHMCMEAMLGTFLYNYLYLKLAKMLCLCLFFYYLFCFLFNKTGEQEGSTGSAQKLAGGWGVVDGAQTMYTHVSKCKNDKIKK
jgi:hypothetical protein